MTKGYVHIYYGDGKGKTSSAIGLAIRSAGAGNKVFLTRFLKDANSSELCVLKKISGITLGDAPIKLPFYFSMTPKQKNDYKLYAHKLLDRAKEEMQNYDVVILDEFIDAVNLEIFNLEEAIAFVNAKPDATELVLTGHSVPKELKALADYVSFVKAEKHPFNNGVVARKGIEY